MVASGELTGPIAIGRDHLDCGSVASPYRETESMLDGSDAIADWPLLNALVNTASGATWVSIHHGGGVGMGRSIHAGQVTVADGTDLAAQKIERVLSNDPGMGVIRHVDAGYDDAAEVARRARGTGPDAGVLQTHRRLVSDPRGCCTQGDRRRVDGLQGRRSQRVRRRGDRSSARAARGHLGLVGAAGRPALVPGLHLGLGVAGRRHHRGTALQLTPRLDDPPVEVGHDAAHALLGGLPVQLLASRTASSLRSASAGGSTPVIRSRSIRPLTHQSGSCRSGSRSGLPAPGRLSNSPRAMAARTWCSTHSVCCSIRCRGASSSSASSASTREAAGRARG